MPNARTSTDSLWLEPGCRLDRYELLMAVAEGGMAKLWVARQKGKRGFDRIVAIKTILPKYAAEVGFQQMFLDEARLASRIEHENVAQVLDLGDDHGVLFLVMEWVDGDSLINLGRAASRANVRIPIGVLGRIVADACAGLHAAHEIVDDEGICLNVVHRDVSPHNLLVAPRGVTKVIDFGIAKARNRSVPDTNAGVLKGKVTYMSPEQVMGGDLDRRTDVWSAGATLYRFLANRTPYSASSPVAVLRLVMSRKPPDPLPDSIPGPIRDVVHKALEIEPANRFQTADEMRVELEAAMRRSDVATTAEQVAEFMSEHLGEGRAIRAKRIEFALRESRKLSLYPANEAAGLASPSRLEAVRSAARMRVSTPNEPAGDLPVEAVGPLDPRPPATASAASQAAIVVTPGRGTVFTQAPNGDLARAPATPQRLAAAPEVIDARVSKTPQRLTAAPEVMDPRASSPSAHSPLAAASPRSSLATPLAGDPSTMTPVEAPPPRRGPEIVLTRVAPIPIPAPAPPRRVALWVQATALLVASSGLLVAGRFLFAAPAPSPSQVAASGAAAPQATPQASPVAIGEVTAHDVGPLPSSEARPSPSASGVWPGAAPSGAPMDESPAALMQRARKAQSAGRLAEAKSALSLASAKSPGDCEVLSRLAEVESAMGQNAQSVADYRRALASNERYFPAVLGLADTLWAGGQTAEARTLYKRILDGYPASLRPARAADRAAAP